MTFCHTKLSLVNTYEIKTGWTCIVKEYGNKIKQEVEYKITGSNKIRGKILVIEAIEGSSTYSVCERFI